MNKLRSLWYVLTSNAFCIMSEKGIASKLPMNNRQALEGLQDEVIKFDEFLEEQINDLKLEERE